MSDVTKDPSGFSSAFTARYDEATELFFHKLELNDRIILNVHINGILDHTFDVPLSTRTTISEPIASGYTSDEDEELHVADNSVEPRLVIGNHANLKIAIVAGEIGKLVGKFLLNPKDMVLSIGSRWFGLGDVVAKDDFEKLMFVLSNLKRVLSE